MTDQLLTFLEQTAENLDTAVAKIHENRETIIRLQELTVALQSVAAEQAERLRALSEQVREIEGYVDRTETEV